MIYTASIHSGCVMSIASSLGDADTWESDKEVVGSSELTLIVNIYRKKN